MKTRTSAAILLLVLSGIACLAQGGRGMRNGVPFTYASALAPWTGANNQQVLMKLVGTTPDGKAVFQKEDGKIVTTALQNLSAESQEQVRECERKMKEAGYTYRAGFWYSAEDLAAAEKTAQAQPAPATAPTPPTVQKAPPPKLVCRVASTVKEDANPGTFVAPGTAPWNLMVGGKPFSVESVSRTFEATVQSFAAEMETYEVHWYVVGRPFTFKAGTGHSGPAEVVESETETVTCKPRGTVQTRWTTKSYPENKDVKKMAGDMIKFGRRLGSHYEIEGLNEYKAVVVQVLRGGELVRSYSSAPEYAAAADVYPLVIGKKP